MAAMVTSRRLVEGPLSKWTNVVNGWQYRWFVLDQNTGLLSYYTSKDKMKRGSRRGCFQLKRSIIGIDDEDDCTFTIRVDSRTYHFQAQDSKEREQWVHALESCMRRLQQPIRHLEVMLPESNSGLSLDQRMAETEAYYHLMRDQLDALSKKLNSSEEASQIKQTAKTMLEALQQCIDLMKDAQLSEGDSSRSPSCEQEVVEHEATQEHVNTSTFSAGEEVSQISDEDEDESSESTDSDGTNVSSDEYFDADAELGLLPSPGLVVTSPSVSIPPAEGDPSDIEEDVEFTEDNDTSNAVAENKSLIMHMLSQVKLGMDLTRIVLPTFILEKRSLLEMYAEFFAHPDLFASIPDHQDAKDRMIASVRYYLSSFHSARKGMVAKKPYNPILGEIFRCYWDLPNATRNPPDENAKTILETGPVPYASYNSVTFVAEQVSHHPPISGLYAECPSKRMYVHGHLWTKSKFLGLSLGVHNIGDVHLHLLDYGEEYICTMPNAYGRSILTIPWLELGGKCHINCAQTGFYAEVEFHCKPFYGGKKHRVTADLYHVSDKKPFMKVEGEWNGVMYIKHPNGDREVFMDTLNTPTVRKKLQKLSSQDPGESRYRWRHVTEALGRKDVEAASEGKHMLEEKQRADAKERQQLGIEWKQKLFHAVEDTWLYNEPLKDRLERHT